MNAVIESIAMRCRTVVLAVLIGAGLLVVCVDRAAAAPGVEGALDDAYLYSYTTEWDIVHVSGWAYNANTAPTQSVKFVAYYSGGGDDQSMGYSEDVLYAANDRSDLVASGRTGTPYVGFSGNVAWRRENSAHAEWICAYAHDTGEGGGWYPLGNCATVH